MDEDSFKNMEAEQRKEIEIEKQRLERELQETLRGKYFVGGSKKRQADWEKELDQGRAENHKKLKEYSELLESKRYEDYGGSKEIAQKALEQENQRNREKELEKQRIQQEEFRQQQLEKQKEQEQKTKKEKSLQEDFNKQKLEQQQQQKDKLQKEKNQDQENARREELRRQFNRKSSRDQSRGR